MSRVSEAYAYLNAKPEHLYSVLFEIRAIAITEKLKEERRRLKWYREKEESQLSLDIF